MFAPDYRLIRSDVGVEPRVVPAHFAVGHSNGHWSASAREHQHQQRVTIL